MPEISIQKQCAALTDLIDTESFGEPIGDLPQADRQRVLRRGEPDCWDLAMRTRQIAARLGHH